MGHFPCSCGHWPLQGGVMHFSCQSKENATIPWLPGPTTVRTTSREPREQPQGPGEGKGSAVPGMALERPSPPPAEWTSAKRWPGDNGKRWLGILPCLLNPQQECQENRQMGHLCRTRSPRSPEGSSPALPGDSACASSNLSLRLRAPEGVFQTRRAQSRRQT